jgi:hypothetical protein
MSSDDTSSARASAPQNPFDSGRRGLKEIWAARKYRVALTLGRG